MEILRGWWCSEIWFWEHRWLLFWYSMFLARSLNRHDRNLRGAFVKNFSLQLHMLLTLMSTCVCVDLYLTYSNKTTTFQTGNIKLSLFSRQLATYCSIWLWPSSPDPLWHVPQAAYFTSYFKLFLSWLRGCREWHHICSQVSEWGNPDAQAWKDAGFSKYLSFLHDAFKTFYTGPVYLCLLIHPPAAIKQFKVSLTVLFFL